MRLLSKRAWRLVCVPLVCSSVISYILFLPLVFDGHGRTYSYLPINLLLAWVAFGVTQLLVWTLRRAVWSSWRAIMLSAVWLFFLPNTFYMLSDYIHLVEVPSVDMLYAVAVFSSFIFNSLLLGMLSLYAIHRQLLRRISTTAAFWTIQAIIFMCSFGIYIGRELRWNTWDIVANAPSLVFDVSERLLHPGAHPSMVPLTAGFFVFLAGFYMVIWHFAELAQPPAAKRS